MLDEKSTPASKIEVSFMGNGRHITLGYTHSCVERDPNDLILSVSAKSNYYL
jgi:hypothetical protein